MLNLIVILSYFSHAETKSGRYFGLTLLIRDILTRFLSKLLMGFAGFTVKRLVLGKAKQSILPPWSDTDIIIWATIVVSSNFLFYQTLDLQNR